MAVAAFVGVVWQIKMADLAIAALAPVGAVCTTGGAGQRRGMGQADVGDWWIWDARLTSELVLLFLYAGVIALWHAFDDRRLAGRAAGILVLVGVVNLPIIHYSVYWWNTLHQARPTCSKPSTQACVCRCGSASLPSSRCRSP